MSDYLQYMYTNVDVKCIHVYNTLFLHPPSFNASEKLAMFVLVFSVSCKVSFDSVCISIYSTSLSGLHTILLYQVLTFVFCCYYYHICLADSR